MNKRRCLEGPIHRACIDYLHKALPGCVTHHSPNEVPLKGRAVSRAIAKAKWNGTRPGYPDIICHYQGNTMLFEVKAEGNYLTKTQREMRDQLTANGIDYAVVRSIYDIEEALDEWGVRDGWQSIGSIAKRMVRGAVE